MKDNDRLSIEGLIELHLTTQGQAALDPDANLQELGLDSLGVASLVVAIEQQMGIVFPAELLSWDSFATPRRVRLVVGGILADQRAT